MFGYVGNSRDDLVLLLSALKSSARLDPYALNPKKNQHRDGWGYVMYSDKEIMSEKRLDPIFDSVEPIPDFSGTALVIYHARDAGSELRGDLRFQHPFRGEWEDGTILLCHNGVLDKKRLSEELKQPVNLEGVVDSEIALKYITQQMNEGVSLEGATTRLEPFTKLNSGLNLLILELPKSETPKLHVKQFYRRDSNAGEDRTVYYQINYKKLSGGIAVFSSSLSQVEMKFERSEVLQTTRLKLVSDLA